MKKKVVTYTIINDETGRSGRSADDLEYLIDIQDDKKRMEYYMVFIGMQQLLSDTDMNGTDWRVLLMLCGLVKRADGLI